MNRQRLGKGLEALIPKDETAGVKDNINEIPVEKIKPNPLQPRNEFKIEKLEELADTIRTYGVIQPIIVQKGRMILFLWPGREGSGPQKLLV